MAGGSHEQDLRTFIRQIVTRQERSLVAMERRVDANTEAVLACVAEMRREGALVREEIRAQREEMRAQRAEMRAEMREQREEMRAGREALFRMLDRLPPPEPNGA